MGIVWYQASKITTIDNNKGHKNSQYYLKFGADPFRDTKAKTCLAMVPIVMKNLNFLLKFPPPP